MDMLNVSGGSYRQHVIRLFAAYWNKWLKRQVFSRWRVYVLHKLHKQRATSKTTYFHQMTPYQKFSRPYLIKNAMSGRWYLRRSMIVWREFVIHKTRKRFLKDRVQQAYNTTIVRTFFRTWISNCSFNMNLGNAMFEYETKILKRYFKSWQNYWNTNIRKLWLYEIADRHYEKKLSAQCLKSFTLYIREKRIRRMKIEKADIFYSRKILCNTFFIWQRKHYIKQNGLLHTQRIQQKIKDELFRKAFSCWQLYIFNKKCVNRKIFMALNQYQKKLIVTSFGKLQKYILYRKEKKIKLSRFSFRTAAVVYKVQDVYMFKWRKALGVLIREKRLMFQAIQVWQARVMHNYFFAWMAFSVQYKKKVSRKRELNKVALCVLLRRYMFLWLSKYKQLTANTENNKITIPTIESVALQTYINDSCNYVEEKAKNKAEAKGAKNLHEKMLLNDGLISMLRKSLLNTEIGSERKIGSPMKKSLKDFETLRKFFAGWLALIPLRSQCNSGISTVLESLQGTQLVLPEYMFRSLESVYDANNICTMYKYTNK